MDDQDKIRRVLSGARTIAVVGASANPARPSHYVMAALQQRGFRVVPVNPGLAGQVLLGETVYGGLRDIPCAIDMVDIFRASEHVPEIVEDAIAIKAKTVWMQLDIRHNAAAAKAETAGLEVVMDRCSKVEAARLGISVNAG